MALRSTVYKAELQIADMDRHHYADHVLTLARHPSETEERLMVRLLAFALHADEALTFGNGLSTADEPDLWRRDLTGAIELWIDVGLPDPKLVRKACGRAARVVVVAYGGAKADVWWSQAADDLARSPNLRVLLLEPEQTAALARFAHRQMRLGVTIQDGSALIASDADSLSIEPRVLQTGIDA
ncbi:MAG TPA: YaeQ family protein [Quisquiliibacterium sp.]|nr:YaeQ family protein [Quisquiliibacterium sp.]HPA88341.1 YaeQ family protein [Quisquiliibacterium sp.]HQN10785.1 YaeQ family protein [Quisquiliibacterium sp.]HQP66646.1 YaeQ family protein [Quisquiliibacterium sp.]